MHVNWPVADCDLAVIATRHTPIIF